MACSERLEVNSIAIELTTRCNQQCRYCYNNKPLDTPAAVPAEPDTATLLARLRRLFDELSLEHVTLTGGEPFLRDHIWAVLELLRERELRHQIISNGGLITPAVAERLAPYEPRYVQLTLNGPDAATHAEHSGAPGHFDRTIAGIRALQEVGIPIVGCVVVTRRNAHRLGEVLELWREDLGVRTIALSRFSPAGYAVPEAGAFLASLDDMSTAFTQAQPFARDRDMTIHCTMPIPPCMMEVADFAPIRFGSCSIGTPMQEFALGIDGALRHCPLHRSPIGGPHDVADPELDLAAIVGSTTVTAYRDSHPEFCDGCLHARSCGGGCGAASDWVVGPADRRNPDPFLWQHIDDELATVLARQREAAPDASAAEDRIAGNAASECSPDPKPR